MSTDYGDAESQRCQNDDHKHADRVKETRNRPPRVHVLLPEIALGQVVQFSLLMGFKPCLIVERVDVHRIERRIFLPDLLRHLALFLSLPHSSVYLFIASTRPPV